MIIEVEISDEGYLYRFYSIRGNRYNTDFHCIFKSDTENSTGIEHPFYGEYHIISYDNNCIPKETYKRIYPILNESVEDFVKRALCFVNN